MTVPRSLDHIHQHDMQPKTATANMDMVPLTGPFRAAFMAGTSRRDPPSPSGAARPARLGHAPTIQAGPAVPDRQANRSGAVRRHNPYRCRAERHPANRLTAACAVADGNRLGGTVRPASRSYARRAIACWHGAALQDAA
ncbi:hypothetical protein FRAAL5500 [Frankia alni ACN14a]|uniref:Uncharacterized protein n=1 Tax=Frankia alni (strain DSM 45986 / CECT 9034 / ACN14a) TaxID=326424 RepID=Q0REH7_FRAAA|nr:hypothetical protein FRAAL5500 [Frankia alni ACN14a]